MTQAIGSGTRRARLGPDYWRMWWANAISSTGDGAFTAALPLLAVTITRDPRLVAVVTATTGSRSCGGRRPSRRRSSPWSRS
jgi:hypothetical protein